ncbi:hypothetical protein BB560_002183 [Smittium megazygosporum]|uniref:SCP domain-containing protein n=1 Tax=Smittium megazygosporum TaxID=133381 RepID=A0A2T9ZFI9_9FUNG|nr:hypothetical protein BB560_002183 [Smittium megazygosporum]
MAVRDMRGTESDYSSIAGNLLCAINKQRVKAGLHPLVLYQGLVRTAIGQSKYQSSIRQMTHDNPVPLGNRVRKQGLEYSSVSENVAFNANSPENAVQLWMNSPPHRRNMLDPNAVYFGGSNYGKYWTAQFGSPESQAEIQNARSNAVVCPGTSNSNFQQNSIDDSDSGSDSVGIGSIGNPGLSGISYGPRPVVVVRPQFGNRYSRNRGNKHRVVKLIKH